MPNCGSCAGEESGGLCFTCLICRLAPPPPPPPAGHPVHLPHLIGPFEHYLWILKTTHSGAARRPQRRREACACAISRVGEEVWSQHTRTYARLSVCVSFSDTTPTVYVCVCVRGSPLQAPTWIRATPWPRGSWTETWHGSLEVRCRCGGWWWWWWWRGGGAIRRNACKDCCCYPNTLTLPSPPFPQTSWPTATSGGCPARLWRRGTA